MHTRTALYSAMNAVGPLPSVFLVLAPPSLLTSPMAHALSSLVSLPSQLSHLALPFQDTSRCPGCANRQRRGALVPFASLDGVKGGARGQSRGGGRSGSGLSQEPVAGQSRIVWAAPSCLRRCHYRGLPCPAVWVSRRLGPTAEPTTAGAIHGRRGAKGREGA